VKGKWLRATIEMFSLCLVRNGGSSEPVTATSLIRWEEPDEPGERRRRCLQHPPRIRFERFDSRLGEYFECGRGSEESTINA